MGRTPEGVPPKFFMFIGFFSFPKPKGPFRTKNATTIAKLVNYYAVVFLLRPPNLVRRGPLLEGKNVCNSQENGVRTRRTAIVNHPAVLKILRVVNLLRVVFLVRRGPLGRRGALLMRPRQLTKMMKMAGVTHARTQFAKNTAVATPKVGVFRRHSSDDA